MKLKSIIPPSTAVAAARTIHAITHVSQTLETAREKLRDHFPARLVHFDGDSVGVFAPAQDGARGPLGHLGVCIGRITRA